LPNEEALKLIAAAPMSMQSLEEQEMWLQIFKERPEFWEAEKTRLLAHLRSVTA